MSHCHICPIVLFRICRMGFKLYTSPASVPDCMCMLSDILMNMSTVLFALLASSGTLPTNVCHNHNQICDIWQVVSAAIKHDCATRGLLLSVSCPPLCGAIVQYLADSS